MPRAGRGLVVAQEAPGVPRGVGTVGCTEHPGAHPPERAGRGVVGEQATARHHETGWVPVERRQTLGRLAREQRVVVFVPTRERAESFEGLHRAHGTATIGPGIPG